MSVSNEEYFERWEASAPTPVVTKMTPEKVAQTQGTRLDKKAPWETYNIESKIDPATAAAMADYETRVHDDSSNQTKEELARWKEGNEAVAKEYQWCTPEEYKDIQQRFGRIRHSSELILMLRKLCHLHVFYRVHPHADKLTLVFTDKYNNAKPEIGCWVQKGWMPEYTVMGFDEHNVPLAEKYRGWRTVLLQLILKGVLKESVAHKVFGKAVAPCSTRYNTYLYGLRNRK